MVAIVLGIVALVIYVECVLLPELGYKPHFSEFFEKLTRGKGDTQ